MSFATSFPPFIARVAVNLPSWRGLLCSGFLSWQREGRAVDPRNYVPHLPARIPPATQASSSGRSRRRAQGRSPGGPPPPPTPFFRAKWSPKGRKKKFFWEPLPLPYLRVWMTGSPLSWRSRCITEFAVIQWVVSFAAVIRVVTRHATLLSTSVAWRVTTLITAAKETIQWADWVYKGSFPRWKWTTAQVLFRILLCHWSWKHCSHI